MKPKIILSLLLSYFTSFTISAQPGALDVEFGVDGFVRQAFELPSVQNYEGHTVLEKPDGKILAAGKSGNDGVIARFNPDGSVDSLSPNYIGFILKGGALIFKGGVFPSIGLIMDNPAFYDLLVQPDGKMVLVGKVDLLVNDINQGARLIVIRQNANGSFDPTFGKYGYGFHMGEENYVAGHSVALQPDGKIVVAGTKFGTNIFLARYHPNGLPDSSFATNGYFLGGPVASKTMLLQPDGRIVVGGQGSSPLSFSMARFNADGTLDTGFGTNGYAVADITDRPDLIYSMELLPDGKILAVGKSGDSLAVARFAGGFLDASYGNNGVSFVHLPGKHLVGTSSVLQPDGKLLVAGYAGPPGFNADDFLLVRLKADGSLDNSFGNGGIVLTDVSPKFDRLEAITLQKDGKILVAGYASRQYQSTWGTEFIVTRYLSGLSVDAPDISTPQNKILIYPNPSLSQATLTWQLPHGIEGEIHITNTLGRPVAIHEVQGESGSLTLEDYPAGLYFVSLVVEGRVVRTERWVHF